MRKFLMAAAIAGLVFAIAVPAMALDFKFGSEYRVRFYDYANTTFNSTNGADGTVSFANNNPGSNVQPAGRVRGNPRGVQIRVRPRFDVSDDNGNIQATIRFEYGDTDFGAGGGANGSGFGNYTGNISNAPSGARFRNGGGGSIGADGVALETKWAYIDFAMPFNVPLRVRAGIQPWYMPKGLIIDDDIAGVRAYGKIAPLSYEAFWFRASKGPNLTAIPAGAAGGATFDTTRDNSLDYYGVRGDLALAKVFNPGIYYVYGENKANCSEPVSAGNYIAFPGVTSTGGCDSRNRAQHYIGATATGDLGFATYDIDFIYGAAKGGPVGNFGRGAVNAGGNATLDPITVKGWVADAGIHIPIGPLKLNLLGSYATGDKQNGGDSEAFPMGPGPSWSGAGGQYELIGEGGAFDVVSSATQHTPLNLWMLGATVEYVPVKPLWIKVAYGFAGFSTKAGNCAFAKGGSNGCFGPGYVSPGFVVGGGLPGQGTGGLAGKSYLGQEVHIRADYTVWTGFKVQTMAGWLFPSSGDTMGKYILQLLYNF